MDLSTLIKKLEDTNHNLPIVFDDGQFVPTGVGSWRGVYKELAIGYKRATKIDDVNVNDNNVNNSEDDQDDGEKHWYPNENDRDIVQRLDTECNTTTVREFLQLLKDTLGNVFRGYKEGEFEMCGYVDVWVANFGFSQGFKTPVRDKWYTRVVGIDETDTCVKIVTVVDKVA